jgi:hypothetical protein
MAFAICKVSGIALLLLATAAPTPARAGERLTATGGVTQLEGAAGGGLVPWAVIAGYGTRDEIGASAFLTRTDTKGFRLDAGGLSIGIKDRLEFSLARQHFNLGDTVPGESIEQDIVGIKLKLSGDAVFDQDSPWPQLSAGLQHKHNRDFNLVPKLLGARHDTGIDYYLSATKLYLAAVAGRNLLLNATLRATKANQLGLLGFGGDRQDRYQVQCEVSAVLLVNDNFGIGAEYRQKPDNLGIYRESDFKDIFAVWFLRKEISLTAGYVSLGNIANKPDQHGLYLSVQGAF